MNNTPDQPLNPPEESMQTEESFDDQREQAIREREIEELYTIDVKVKPLSLDTRGEAVLVGFHNDEFDVDEAVDVVKDLLTEREEHTKRIASLNEWIERASHRLENTYHGKRQAGDLV